MPPNGFSTDYVEQTQGGKNMIGIGIVIIMTHLLAMANGNEVNGRKLDPRKMRDRKHLERRLKMEGKKIIYYGDNLVILRSMTDETVDLIYLDPPFNSKRVYNIVFGKEKGAQVKAFTDTWKWNNETQKLFDDILQSSNGCNANAETKKLIKSFHDALGTCPLMAYLVMMTPRLVELRRVLKKTGSIYLHCDSTASHYLKVLMDSIFGPKNFRNEIVWCYSRPSAPNQKQLSRVHEIILWYSKSDEWYFNPDVIRQPYAQSSLDRDGYGGKASKMTKGKPVTLKTGGKFPEDWIYIPQVKGNSNEATGYPTQKPEALLERIIKAGCPPDGTVLDPFCGCGTALVVAEKLGRRWIGIDITYIAVYVLQQRLSKDFPNAIFDIDGDPVDVDSAIEMAKKDRHQFAIWAIAKISGTPSSKLSGDEGIDGYIWFKDGAMNKQGVVQVKSGKVDPSKIRDFCHTIDREEAAIGVFITIEKPSESMMKEAATSGLYEDSFGNKYNKVQIMTVEDILTGKKPDVPQLIPFIQKREGIQLYKPTKQKRLTVHTSKKSMLEIAVTPNCPTCGTQLKRNGATMGYCPQCSPGTDKYIGE